MNKSQELLEQISEVKAGKDVLDKIKLGDIVSDDDGKKLSIPHVGLNKGIVTFVDSTLTIRRKGLSGEKEVNIYKDEIKAFKDFVRKI